MDPEAEENPAGALEELGKLFAQGLSGEGLVRAESLHSTLRAQPGTRPHLRLRVPLGHEEDELLLLGYIPENGHDPRIHTTREVEELRVRAVAILGISGSDGDGCRGKDQDPTVQGIQDPGSSLPKELRGEA
jgi:hypothetical protein